MSGAASRSSRARQASRSPPSAYRIRSSARRPGGPARLRATTTSVHWPTTSRPSRIQLRRASSSRRPAASPTAVPRAAGAACGSRRTSRVSVRRARAARRWSRSATRAGRVPVSRRDGRSATRRSTVRPLSSAAAIDRPSSRSSGLITTSHSSRIPRATASTGSKLRQRSSQATIEPAAWASATSRRASVVLPLPPAPRRARLLERGIPSVPRIASRAGKPVETTSPGNRDGSGRSCGSSDGSGAVARAPTTSPTASPTPIVPCRGAAVPQRDRRVARAAVTSGERFGIGRRLSNRCSISSMAAMPCPRWTNGAPEGRAPRRIGALLTPPVLSVHGLPQHDRQFDQGKRIGRRPGQDPAGHSRWTADGSRRPLNSPRRSRPAPSRLRSQPVPAIACGAAVPGAARHPPGPRSPARTSWRGRPTMSPPARGRS